MSQPNAIRSPRRAKLTVGSVSGEVLAGKSGGLQIVEVMMGGVIIPFVAERWVDTAGGQHFFTKGLQSGN
jgi:hypothetical protein